MERLPGHRVALFLLPAVLGCMTDLATKAWFFSWPSLRAGEVYWLWTGHVGIELSRNLGALFGIGQGKVWLFAALSVAAAIAIPIWLFRFGAGRDAWLTLALGCVMAGVLGNLYDRLGLSGDGWFGPGRTEEQAVFAVRDWMLWQVNNRWRWPNFNVADSLLVCGATVLFFRALWQPHCPSGEPTDETPAERVPSDVTAR